MDDVQKIARNLDMPEFQVRRIKDHIFYNTIGLYAFCTDLGNSGKVSINKQTDECFIIEEPENEGILIQHWIKEEFPDRTCWAS